MLCQELFLPLLGTKAVESQNTLFTFTALQCKGNYLAASKFLQA